MWLLGAGHTGCSCHILTIHFNRSVAPTSVFFLTVTATTFSSAAIVWCFVLPDDHSPDRTVLQTRGKSLKNKRRISLHDYVKIIDRKNWPWLERTLFIGWTSYLLFLFQIRSHKCKYQVCFTCWRNLWNCDLCQVCGSCLRISNATISALAISLQRQKLWMWQWVPLLYNPLYLVSFRIWYGFTQKYMWDKTEAQQLLVIRFSSWSGVTSVVCFCDHDISQVAFFKLWMTLELADTVSQHLLHCEEAMGMR